MPPSDIRPTAVIVEDEPALRDELREALARLWPELHIVAEAGNGVEALRMVAEHRPQLVFLDIQIPEPNGLDVARFIGNRCHVVFVTAYDEYAIAAFEEGAADYLLKPIGEARLAVTVQRMRQRLAQSPPDLTGMAERLQADRPRAPYLRWLTAPAGKGMRMILIDEVIYFRSDLKYTRIALADAELLVRRTLKDLLAELDPEQFWQIHRSTVVNVQEIAGIEPDMAGQLTVRLRSRREALPVSASFARRLREM